MFPKHFKSSNRSTIPSLSLCDFSSYWLECSPYLTLIRVSCSLTVVSTPEFPGSSARRNLLAITGKPSACLYSFRLSLRPSRVFVPIELLPIRHESYRRSFWTSAIFTTATSFCRGDICRPIKHRPSIVISLSSRPSEDNIRRVSKTLSYDDRTCSLHARPRSEHTRIMIILCYAGKSGEQCSLYILEAIGFTTVTSTLK